MKKSYRVGARGTRSVAASRNIGNPRMRSSAVRSSRNVKRNGRVMAAKVYSDGFGNYRPWSGAVETWDNLEAFDRLDTLESYIDEAYYDDGVGEGLINETALNDLLWFEPEFVYEIVGLYYNADTGEVSDEPFDDDYVEESARIKGRRVTASSKSRNAMNRARFSRR